MIRTLRVLFGVVLLTMFVVTTWASLHVALWNMPRAVATHPWFTATLFDTYFAFLTFYCWVAYKETGIVARIFWFIAIILLGNIAMASYMLIQLFRIPSRASIKDFLLRSAP